MWHLTTNVQLLVAIIFMLQQKYQYFPTITQTVNIQINLVLSLASILSCIAELLDSQVYNGTVTIEEDMINKYLVCTS